MKTDEELAARSVAALELLKQLEGLGFGDDIDKKFTISGAPDRYLRMLASLAESTKPPPGPPSKLRPKSGSEPVIDHLVAEIEADSFSAAHAASIQLLMLIEEDWPWSALIAAIEAKLASESLTDVGMIQALVVALLVIRREGVDEAEAAFSNLAKKGHLLDHLYTARSAPSAEAEASLMVALIEFLPSGQPNAAVGNSASGMNIFNDAISSPAEDLASAAAGLVTRVGGLNVLVEAAADTSSVRPFVQSVLSQVAARPDAARWIAAPLLVNRFPFVRRALNDDYVPRLLEQDDYRSEVEQAVLRRGFLKSLAELYIMLVNRGVEDAALEEMLVEGLKLLPKDSWAASLHNSDATLELALKLNETRQLAVGTPLREALLEDVHTLLEEPESHANVTDPRAVALLSRDSRETFVRNLRDELLRNPGQDASAVVTAFRSYLENEEILAEKADDLVRTFFPRVVERQSAEELDWICAVIEGNRTFMDKAAPASRNAFAEDVRALFASERSPTPLLVRMAKLLGLDPQQEDDDAEGERQHDDHGADTVQEDS